MESVKVVKKRNPMISIAKAIGIIFMVVGHVYDKESWGVHYIYMFHMPLFFVLSGYFFKSPRSIKGFLVFIKKKLIGLYLPYFFWSVFFILIHNFLLKFDIGTTLYSLHDTLLSIFISTVQFVTTEKILVGFWFLKALFSACIFMALFGYITHAPKGKVYQFTFFSLLCILLMQFFGFSNLTLLGMFYGGIFLAFGYFYRNLELEKVLCKNVWIIFFAVIVLLISRIYSNIENTEMLYVDKITFFPFTLTGLLGSYMVMLVSRKIALYDRSKIVSFLRYVGNHTMIILALHYPLIKIFDFYFLQNINDFTSIRLFSGGAIGVVVPIAIYRIYEIIRNKLQKYER